MSNYGSDYGADYYGSSHNDCYKTRRERAVTQRLYLLEEVLKSDDIIEYSICGTSGNVYSIKFGKRKTVSCTCPDHQTRRITCKHMYFVELSVLGDRSRDEAWEYAKERIEKNLSVIDKSRTSANNKDIDPDNNNDSNNNNSKKERFVAPNNVLKEYNKRKLEAEPQGGEINKVEKREWIDKECPICFEKMGKFEATVYCEYVCGNSVHSDCFDIWKAKQDICVYCRSPWDPAKPKKPRSDYINLEDVLK